MDKKKLKWYAILAAAAIAATLLFPIVIREGSGWIAGKILENAGLETETGGEPETERPSGDGKRCGIRGRAGNPAWYRKSAWRDRYGCGDRSRRRTGNCAAGRNGIGCAGQRCAGYAGRNGTG
mgnify:CR=1 FL=1